MNRGGVAVVAEHTKGVLGDITLEMLACGRELADASRTELTCIILTDNPGPFEALPLAADRTIIVKDPALASFNPEAYVRVLGHLLKDLSPSLVLFGSTGMGMDLDGPLSIALGATVISGCAKIQFAEGKLRFASRLYGGKLVAQSEVDGGLALALLMAGNYPKEGGMRDRVPPVEVQTPPAPLTGLRVQFRELIEPEAGDVDLTKAPILVGAGRGIQARENLDKLTELARLLGGALCASRPVIDQGWLPRSRQVGRSGAIVKPRLYLALGISGAPEHLEGIRESDLIVAINTDETAPIFDVAHYGAVHDLLKVVPHLIEAVRAAREG